MSKTILSVWQRAISSVIVILGILAGLAIERRWPQRSNLILGIIITALILFTVAGFIYQRRKKNDTGGQR